MSPVEAMNGARAKVAAIRKAKGVATAIAAAKRFAR
jgi:hypothetical protein